MASCHVYSSDINSHTHTSGNQSEVEEGRVLFPWQRHCLAAAGGRFGGRETVKEREDGVKESLEQQRGGRPFTRSRRFSWFTSIRPTSTTWHFLLLMHLWVLCCFD